MAGGTHVFDMIKQLRNNEARRKKSYFKSDVLTAKGEQIDDVSASPETLEAIRNRAMNETKREAKKSMLVLLISALLALVLVITFILIF